MIQRINIKQKELLNKIKERSKKNLEAASVRVLPIVNGVKKFGDKALFEYIEKYDCFKATKNNILVSKEEIKRAYSKVSAETIKAIKEAKKNIEEYSRLQLPKEWSKEVKKGIRVGQLVKPLDSVGCYVPGGNFPLVSTVIMTVVPAKAAGVKEVIVCSPAKEDNYVMYAAADIAGADKIYRIGGAQAIAAMAYGTESVCKVDKIVGPGNIFVTAAKKLVYGDVGIDFLAGPSEVMIIAEYGNPKFIAADMLAQAEHDLMASAVLITTDEKLAEGVERELNKQLNELNVKSFAAESLRKYGAIVIADDIDSAIDMANGFAPEHLEIIVKDKSKVIEKLNNFGALFIGEYSPEAAGDYVAGPNHVLPTGGVAKFRAGLSVLDFVKMPTVQELSKDGLKSLKGAIEKIASVEGLEAHKKSVERRF
ncbi:MAG: histidinol dehydrogenase [Nanoarchaeota archaeon]|nr:histidinol dehydrogenase [Nanoarchaeota archaeon]MBU1005457.1 histidinol dehydrogenase [Nanoarchaeota archaeon]MBU1947027.1 histidinol dehydrogenase [Nanoarchaeota archaeon]